MLYNLSKSRLSFHFLRSSSTKCRSTGRSCSISSSIYNDYYCVPQQEPKNSRRCLFSTSSSFFSTATTTGSKDTSYRLTEKEQHFYEMGWLDERGLTNFDTLHELAYRSSKIFADNDCLGMYVPHKKQFSYGTYRMAEEAIQHCRVVFKDIGVEQYDKIGLISNNRWEWACVAAAAFSLNATIVPMYEQQHASDWLYIVNDSQCSALMCSTMNVYNRVQKEVVPSSSTLQKSGVFCFDAPVEEDFSFERLMLHATPDVEGSFIVPPLPEDLCNIMYTSGTTGKPKGVELTHENIATNVKSSSRSMVKNPREHIFESDRSLSILPWAHIYGQTGELWMGWAHGCSSGLTRGYEYIQEDLQLVQPTVIAAVPALYKKVFDGLQKHIEDRTICTESEKVIVQRALRFGRKKVLASRGEGPALTMIETMRHKLLDKLVLSKIRERLGGRVRYGFNGGAACPQEVIDFMDSIGIEVLEGYGLSETSPIVTVNSPEQRKVGTVGRPIEDVSVFIIDPEDNGKIPTPLPPGKEGEICCVGPNIMKAYHNNIDETNQAITIAPDGKSRMFHTGDLGVQDDDGYFRVTGRIKEQYKLDNGKYVVPTPIENTLGLSRFIAQMVLIGANRPYNVALIVPDYDMLKHELKMDDINIIDRGKLGYNHRRNDDSQNNNEKVVFNNGLFMIDKEDIEMIHNDQRVKDLISAEINQCSLKLKKYEMPKKWSFISPLTVENKMLTAKMSIRRKKVTEEYSELISTLYEEQMEEKIVA